MADKIMLAPGNWASLTAYAALYGYSAEAKPEAGLDSAAHVKATAKGASLGDHDEILITLTIDPGYHVTANPASLDYLIPTGSRCPGPLRPGSLIPRDKSSGPNSPPRGQGHEDGQGFRRFARPQGNDGESGGHGRPDDLFS